MGAKKRPKLARIDASVISPADHVAASLTNADNGGHDCYIGSYE
jgi:hypothetical protein